MQKYFIVQPSFYIRLFCFIIIYKNLPGYGEIFTFTIIYFHTKQNDKPGYVVNDHLSGITVTGNL